VPNLPENYQADLPSPEAIAERLQQWATPGEETDSPRPMQP
jgi:hypothetical protein